MLFLQALPTQTWTDDDLELLVSKAFEMKMLYQDQNSRLLMGNQIATSNNFMKK